jgi:hypothetical protein
VLVASPLAPDRPFRQDRETDVASGGRGTQPRAAPRGRPPSRSCLRRPSVPAVAGPVYKPTVRRYHFSSARSGTTPGLRIMRLAGPLLGAARRRRKVA